MQGKPNIWKIDASREDFRPTHREAKVIISEFLKRKISFTSVDVSREPKRRQEVNDSSSMILGILKINLDLTFK